MALGDVYNISLEGLLSDGPIESHIAGLYPYERTRLGMEGGLVVWTPSIGPSGLTIYIGGRFAKWKANLFVGALAARKEGSQDHRAGLSKNPPHQESVLASPYMRIRDFRQGPDGALYVLIDQRNGPLLKGDREPSPGAVTP